MGRMRLDSLIFWKITSDSWSFGSFSTMYANLESWKNPGFKDIVGGS